ncbi:MAG: helix-turn-helix domain-containing protein [Chloroflexi bacterium]|nr:helix-turn-helix domain-containing protein [Chloroflexota bacterium]
MGTSWCGVKKGTHQEPHIDQTEFGKLIASLRKERRDEYSRPWSQGRLAREVNLTLGAPFFSERIIARIERGQRGIDDSSAAALATALGLTSAERHEFCLAASALHRDKVARQDGDPLKVLSLLMGRLKVTPHPACIVDSYCDILAVNALAGELLPGVKIDGQGAFPLNLMRLALGNGAVHQPTRRLPTEDARPLLMMFRIFSLRYRSTAYFQALLAELMGHRFFQRYWHEIDTEEEDQCVMNSADLHLHSREWGNLAFFALTSTAVTPAGELHLIIFAPASRKTSATLGEIAVGCRVGGIRRLDTLWPRKTPPQPDSNGRGHTWC